MGRVTLDLLRRRAEHNDRRLSGLRELALHGQHLERIQLLNQHCRHLKILLLQNNVISVIEGLQRMKVQAGDRGGLREGAPCRG